MSMDCMKERKCKKTVKRVKKYVEGDCGDVFIVIPSFV